MTHVQHSKDLLKMLTCEQMAEERDRATCSPIRTPVRFNVRNLNQPHVYHNSEKGFHLCYGGKSVEGSSSSECDISSSQLDARSSEIGSGKGNQDPPQYQTHPQNLDHCHLHVSCRLPDLPCVERHPVYYPNDSNEVMNPFSYF